MNRALSHQFAKPPAFAYYPILPLRIALLGVSLDTWLIKRYCILIRRIKLSNFIQNFDKKRVMLGHAATAWIIVSSKNSRERSKNRTVRQPGSRESVSIIETITADGSYLPPFLIWKGSNTRRLGIKLLSTMSAFVDMPMQPQLMAGRTTRWAYIISNTTINIRDNLWRTLRAIFEATVCF